ncbi:MAG: hypothetical protein AMXMBFR84_09270 [Candidatus Hydrogenedentota bacterium]
MKRKGFSRLRRHAWLLVPLILAGCATTDSTLMLDPQGTDKTVTPEEIQHYSGEDLPYLVNVGDQLNLQFRIKEYREGEIPWDYKIEVGDRMEVRVLSKMADGHDYVIDVGDLLGISFLVDWTFNSNRTVRPDGFITMPRIGDVMAAGLKPADLEAKLVNLYKSTGILNEQEQITVNIDFSNPDRLENISRDVIVRPDGAIRVPGVKSDVRIAGLTVGEAGEAVKAEVAKILKNEPEVTLVVFPFINTELTGMNGTYTVRPDGRVSVPRVGEIQAAGYTVEEMRQNLNDLYSQVTFNAVDTHVDVVSPTGARIFVGGEVGVPGVYPLVGAPSALQAILMAGGVNNDARLNSIVVIRRNPNGKPYTFKTNLDLVLKEGKTENDLLLRPFDVVYVPKKIISKVDLFVEQYIDEVVPFDNNLGVTGTYYLNTQKTTSDVKSKSFNSGINLIPTPNNQAIQFTP